MEREGPSPSPLYLLSATAATVYTNRRRRRQMPQQARKLEGALRTKWRRSVERTGGGTEAAEAASEEGESERGGSAPPSSGQRKTGREGMELPEKRRKEERERRILGGGKAASREEERGRPRSVGRSSEGSARNVVGSLPPLPPAFLLRPCSHSVKQGVLGGQEEEDETKRTEREGERS